MINSDAIDAVDRWLGAIVCSFAPGLLVLDCVFGRGLFGTPPATAYEFALFLLYSAAISFAYVYPAQAGLERHLGGEFTNKLKSDQIGIVTVPIVMALAVATVFAYVGIEWIASKNLVGSSSNAKLFNVSLALLVTILISSPLCGLYFKWYKHTFQRPAET